MSGKRYYITLLVGILMASRVAIAQEEALSAKKFSPLISLSPSLCISRGLHSGFRLYPQIESVFVLRGRKMVKITRESFERGNIEDELRVIF
jgi:hypothetical protein